MTNDIVETLGLATVDRIVELRKRLEAACLDLAGLLGAIGPPDTEVKRQVRLCLREASQDVERMLDQVDAAERAARAAIEPSVS
jgi:hypothetical protein